MKKLPLSSFDRELLSRYGLDSHFFDKAVRLSFLRGESLSREGEQLDYIYFVVSGKAKVFISLSSGKQLLLAYFTSKGLIGDIELMTNKPVNYTTVRAVTDFVCIALPLSIYADELKKNNAFVNYVAEELAEKLTQRVINGAITTLQPLEARLCAYITQTAVGGIFRETLTEVAGVVGTSYRHLLRCLDKLCVKEILKKERSGYKIINQILLDETAGDLYVLK